MTLGSRGQRAWQACNSIAVIKICYSDRRRLFPVHLRCCMLHLQQVACRVQVACFAFIFISFLSWLRNNLRFVRVFWFLYVVCVDYDRVGGGERFTFFGNPFCYHCSNCPYIYWDINETVNNNFSFSHIGLLFQAIGIKEINASSDNIHY